MRLIILGAGGFGRTAADVAEQMNAFSQINFLDDRGSGENILGVCKDFGDYIGEDTVFYPAFGNSELRMQWLETLTRAGAQSTVLMHPRAYCSPKARVEAGSILLPGAIVNTDTVVHRGCIINLGAIVDHGCILEEGVHVCVGAIVKAENRLPRLMKIEAGEVIENRTYPL